MTVSLHFRFPASHPSPFIICASFAHGTAVQYRDGVHTYEAFLILLSEQARLYNRKD